jgi:hypothetical protein
VNDAHAAVREMSSMFTAAAGSRFAKQLIRRLRLPQPMHPWRVYVPSSESSGVTDTDVCWRTVRVRPGTIGNWAYATYGDGLDSSDPAGARYDVDGVVWGRFSYDGIRFNSESQSIGGANSNITIPADTFGWWIWAQVEVSGAVNVLNGSTYTPAPNKVLIACCNSLDMASSHELLIYQFLDRNLESLPSYTVSGYITDVYADYVTINNVRGNFPHSSGSINVAKPAWLRIGSYKEQNRYTNSHLTGLSDNSWAGNPCIYPPYSAGDVVTAASACDLLSTTASDGDGGVKVPLDANGGQIYWIDTNNTGRSWFRISSDGSLRAIVPDQDVE